MTSKTITSVLEQFKANKLLNTLDPPRLSSSLKRLRNSHPAEQVDQDVINAAMQALRDGQTHYVDVPGIGPLRSALADYLNEQFGSTYELDNILVTAGVQESRFLTIQKIGEGFEGIIIPEVIHPGVLQAAGVRPPTITKLAVDRTTMLPTLATIRQTLASENGARLLYLESPSRLTGKAYDSAEVAALASLVDEFNTVVIWDQGLAPWTENGRYASLLNHDNIRDEQVVVLGEAWPGMGLDSWFIGYIATPLQWFEPMRSQKQIMSICTNTASQYAALQAGQQFAEARTQQLQKLVQRRQQVAELLAQKNLTPLPGDAATIIALQLTPEEKETVTTTLNEAGFQTVDGAQFGAPNLLRLAVETQ